MKILPSSSYNPSCLSGLVHGFLHAGQSFVWHFVCCDIELFLDHQEFTFVATKCQSAGLFILWSYFWYNIRRPSAAFTVGPSPLTWTRIQSDWFHQLWISWVLSLLMAWSLFCCLLTHPLYHARASYLVQRLQSDFILWVHTHPCSLILSLPYWHTLSLDCMINWPTHTRVLFAPRPPLKHSPINNRALLLAHFPSSICRARM